MPLPAIIFLDRITYIHQVILCKKLRTNQLTTSNFRIGCKKPNPSFPAIRLGAWESVNVLQQLDLHLRELLEEKAGYDPNQPRFPAGNPDGGQWGGNTGTLPQRDLRTTLRHLRENARPKSQGKCARLVRLALKSGGFPVKTIADAKNFGSELTRLGFTTVAIYQGGRYEGNYTPIAGDISVIQPYPSGNESGHITMYDGHSWISDFIQRTMYPGNGYRRYKPPYVIYRYPH